MLRRCTRPNCGGSTFLVRGEYNQAAQFHCLTCARDTPASGILLPPLPAAKWMTEEKHSPEDTKLVFLKESHPRLRGRKKGGKNKPRVRSKSTKQLSTPSSTSL